MNPWFLVRAEWLKTRQRPLSQGVFVAMIGLAVMPAAITASYQLGGAPRTLVEAVATLPAALDLAFSAIARLSGMVASLLVASSVGSEYAQDTWKAILPRAPRRADFLFTKLLVELAGYLLACAVALTVYLVLGAGCAAATNLQWHRGPVPLEPLLLRLAYGALSFVLYGAVALLAAVATRSAVAAMFLSFFGMSFVGMLGDASRHLGRVLPASHLNVLDVHWLGSPISKELSELFGGVPTAAASVAAVLAFCAVMVAIAVMLFRRRDLAG